MGRIWQAIEDVEQLARRQLEGEKERDGRSCDQDGIQDTAVWFVSARRAMFRKCGRREP